MIAPNLLQFKLSPSFGLGRQHVQRNKHACWFIQKVSSFQQFRLSRHVGRVVLGNESSGSARYVAKIDGFARVETVGGYEDRIRVMRVVWFSGQMHVHRCTLCFFDELCPVLAVDCNPDDVEISAVWHDHQFFLWPGRRKLDDEPFAVVRGDRQAHVCRVSSFHINALGSSVGARRSNSFGKFSGLAGLLRGCGEDDGENRRDTDHDDYEGVHGKTFRLKFNPKTIVYINLTPADAMVLCRVSTIPGGRGGLLICVSPKSLDRSRCAAVASRRAFRREAPHAA